MYELTLIEQNGTAYVDSREVATFIGKRHDNLLRDISGYLQILDNSNALKIEGIKFFLESSYVDTRGREKPCYLLTKMGCKMVANKLTGTKGVLFTALYVAKFNEMEAAELAQVEAQLAWSIEQTEQSLESAEQFRELYTDLQQSSSIELRQFNTAVSNILTDYSQTYATPEEVLNFLRVAYKPFGIEVLQESNKHWLTATSIATLCGIKSETGRPHGHAVSAIIKKLNIAPKHIVIMPYGMVGINMRYDDTVLEAVRQYIIDNNLPATIPHLDFEYHIYYDPDWLFLYDNNSESYQMSLSDYYDLDDNCICFCSDQAA